MDEPIALSRSRCRHRRLNNAAQRLSYKVLSCNIASSNVIQSRAGKNLGFLEFFCRFLGFLGFNVHNAEHRYRAMTHDK